MQTIMSIAEIDSEADFIVYSQEYGLLSEHCTLGEARVAFLRETARHSLGQHVPMIFERHDASWVPLN